MEKQENNKDRGKKVEVFSTFSFLTLDKSIRADYNIKRTAKVHIICGDVAQLARATGSYPVGRRFEPHRRYQNI